MAKETFSVIPATLDKSDRANPDKGTGLFYAVNQKAVDALSQLTAADKALTVPYFSMWQVDPSTGKPAFPGDGNTSPANKPKRPLTLQTASPPEFGSSIDGYLKERPAVSVDKITIKTEASKGIITFIVMTMEIVVHRPDAFNSSITSQPDDRNVDDWSSLIIPGNVFGVEYGWSNSPIKNDLFNGVGIDDGQIVINSRRILYFAVTNYTFKIQPDQQIKINITAYETGLQNLQHFIIGSKKTSVDPTKFTKPSHRQFKFAKPSRTAAVNLYSTPEGKAAKQKFTNEVALLKGSNIRLEDLCNTVFAKTIVESFKETGYETVNLFFGRCNKMAGTSSKKFGSAKMGDQSIGDFTIPKKTIQDLINKQFKAGVGLTVNNFMLPFFRLLNDSRNWTSDGTPKKSDGKTSAQKIPEVFVKVVPNGTSISMYVLDAKREFTALTDEYSPENDLGPDAPREKIYEKLGRLGIPVISFGRGNSYIKDASFSVESDAKIKAHFIQKFYEPDKSKNPNQTGAPEKQKSLSAEETLFSAAVIGDITTLGNFAFDTFSLVWLDFGVRRWDGPFNVRSREDHISKGTFETKISFVAAGNDPLNTQGRRQLKDTNVVGAKSNGKVDSVTGNALVAPGNINAAAIAAAAR